MTGIQTDCNVSSESLTRKVPGKGSTLDTAPHDALRPLRPAAAAAAAAASCPHRSQHSRPERPGRCVATEAHCDESFCSLRPVKRLASRGTTTRSRASPPLTPVHGS
eukprot:scaffold30501_cov66-Phaeocystis_antarctica.AAC.1